MKRSTQIKIRRLGQGRRYALAPISLALTSAVLLAGCSDEKQVYYQSVNDCSARYPDQAQACEYAYKQAIADAAESAPKYNSMATCSADFGDNRCVQSPSGNWFMPLMAGFMFGRVYNWGRLGYDYRASPAYTTRNNTVFNPSSYGNYNRSSTGGKVDNVWHPKPKTVTTRSRGGFGSTAAAKSSWGSSRSSSWGGGGRSWGG